MSLPLPNTRFSRNSESGIRGAYCYGFNGKELDKEGMGGGATTYDYGFRIYNAALGKFLSVDPLSASYPWYTSYQFAGNKPIWKIDLDGLEESSSQANDENSDILQSDLNAVEITAEAPIATVTIVEKYREASGWQNFVGWLKGVERGMRGTAYWEFGIEFKTTTGESNDQTANLVAKENYKYVLTIENWDEVSELLDILGAGQKDNAFENSFSTNIYRIPKGLGDYNTLRKKWAGTGRNSPKEASARFHRLQKRLEYLNTQYARVNPGSSQIGSYNVNGNASDIQGDPMFQKITSSQVESATTEKVFIIHLNTDSVSTAPFEVEDNEENRKLENKHGIKWKSEVKGKIKEQ